MNTLSKICEQKQEHIQRKKQETPWVELEERAKNAPVVRPFLKALIKQKKHFPIIAEIKKASPSGGLIRPDFSPVDLARIYERSGATCLSVLTDEPFFQGKDEDLVSARDACQLPVLRKDFMLDPYQVVEARALGADCILLIMACLSDYQAKLLEQVAYDWGMDVLVETHDEEELTRALELRSPLIGVNNRNLKTLETRLETFEELGKRIPADRLAVAESGLKTRDDLVRMQASGAGAYLMGEVFMREQDVGQAVTNILDSATGISKN